MLPTLIVAGSIRLYGLSAASAAALPKMAASATAAAIHFAMGRRMLVVLIAISLLLVSRLSGSCCCLAVFLAFSVGAVPSPVGRLRENGSGQRSRGRPAASRRWRS